MPRPKGTWYPDAQLAFITDAGHYPMQETPVYLASLVERFLNVHRRAATPQTASATAREENCTALRAQEQSMIARILVTAGIILYGLAVPILEINDTHVFNPEWVPHARLHEVWQLVTNTALGALSLWLVWFRNEVRIPAAITVLVTGGFLAAYFMRESYGGSMVLSDGSEKTLLGLNVGVVGFGLAIALAALAVVLHSRSRVAST